MTELIKNLKEDPDLYRAWKDNIAMSFKDRTYWNATMERISVGNNGESHLRFMITPNELHNIANQAADDFLQLLIK